MMIFLVMVYGYGVHLSSCMFPHEFILHRYHVIHFNLSLLIRT